MINTSFAAGLATTAANGTGARAASYPIPLYNAKGQRCAQLEQDSDGTIWLSKRVDSTKHQLRTPPAWAADADHLAELVRAGGAGVAIVDEVFTEWTATVDDFERFGFPFDRGHGKQIALPLARWKVQRLGEAWQLSLFGGAR
jgi:hypothetical protein